MAQYRSSESLLAGYRASESALVRYPAIFASLACYRASLVGRWQKTPQVRRALAGCPAKGLPERLLWWDMPRGSDDLSETRCQEPCFTRVGGVSLRVFDATPASRAALPQPKMGQATRLPDPLRKARNGSPPRLPDPRRREGADCRVQPELRAHKHPARGDQNGSGNQVA